jgi:hypothetical protein
MIISFLESVLTALLTPGARDTAATSGRGTIDRFIRPERPACGFGGHVRLSGFTRSNLLQFKG